MKKNKVHLYGTILLTIFFNNSYASQPPQNLAELHRKAEEAQTQLAEAQARIVAAQAQAKEEKEQKAAQGLIEEMVQSITKTGTYSFKIEYYGQKPFWRSILFATTLANTKDIDPICLAYIGSGIGSLPMILESKPDLFDQVMQEYNKSPEKYQKSPFKSTFEKIVFSFDLQGEEATTQQFFQEQRAKIMQEFSNRIKNITESTSNTKSADIAKAYEELSSKSVTDDKLQQELTSIVSQVISEKFKGEITKEKSTLYKQLEALKNKYNIDIMPRVLVALGENSPSSNNLFAQVVEQKSFPAFLYCLTLPEYAPLTLVSQILIYLNSTDITKINSFLDELLITLSGNLIDTNFAAKNPAVWKKMLLKCIDDINTKMKTCVGDGCTEAANKLFDKFEYVFKQSLYFDEKSAPSKTPFQNNMSVFRDYFHSYKPKEGVVGYKTIDNTWNRRVDDYYYQLPLTQEIPIFEWIYPKTHYDSAQSFTKKLTALTMKKMSWLKSIFRYSRLALTLRGLYFKTNETRYSKSMELLKAFETVQRSEDSVDSNPISEKRKISVLKDVATILMTVTTRPTVEKQPEKLLLQLLTIDPTGDLIREHVIENLRNNVSKRTSMIHFKFIDQLEKLLEERNKSSDQFVLGEGQEGNRTNVDITTLHAAPFVGKELPRTSTTSKSGRTQPGSTHLGTSEPSLQLSAIEEKRREQEEALRLEQGDIHQMPVDEQSKIIDHA